MNEMSLIGIIEANEFRQKVMEQRNLLKQKHSGKEESNVFAEIRDSLLRIEALLSQQKS
jgi:hypothetical protein